jgi:hypothetical protein
MVRAWKKQAKFTLAAETETVKSLAKGTHFLRIDSDVDLRLDFSNNGTAKTMTSDWPRIILCDLPTEIMVPVADFKDTDTVYAHFYSTADGDVRYLEE